MLLTYRAPYYFFCPDIVKLNLMFSFAVCFIRIGVSVTRFRSVLSLNSLTLMAKIDVILCQQHIGLFFSLSYWPYLLVMMQVSCVMFHCLSCPQSFCVMMSRVGCTSYVVMVLVSLYSSAEHGARNTLFWYETATSRVCCTLPGNQDHPTIYHKVCIWTVLHAD